MIYENDYDEMFPSEYDKRNYIEEHKVYACPTCKKKYRTPEEAENCCPLITQEMLDLDSFGESVYDVISDHPLYLCPTCDNAYEDIDDALYCCIDDCKETLDEKRGAEEYDAMRDKELYHE